jgi:hypothetical protein
LLLKIISLLGLDAAQARNYRYYATWPSAGKARPTSISIGPATGCRPIFSRFRLKMGKIKVALLLMVGEEGKQA